MDNKVKQQLFIDTSGSTEGDCEYYSMVEEIYKKYLNPTSATIFEWARDCAPLTISETEKCFKAKRSNNIDTSSTQIHAIVPFLDPGAEEVLITTDGNLNPVGFEESVKLLSDFRERTLAANLPLPNVQIFIGGQKSRALDDSVVLSLAHGFKRLQVHHAGDADKNEILTVPKIYRNRAEVDEFFAQLDIVKLYIDTDYRRAMHAAVKIMTVGSERISDYVLDKIRERKNHEIARLRRLSEGPFESVSSSDTLLENLAKFKPLSAAFIESEMARLISIAAAYRDITRLHFHKVAPSTALPIYQDNTDSENEGESYPAPSSHLLPPKVTCPITLTEGEPYLILYSDEILSLTTGQLSSLKANPLLLANLLEPYFKLAIGSYFCTNPHSLNGKDPITRRPFIPFNDSDGIPWVLPLGTSHQSIQYTDEILKRALFNDYLPVDMDFVFIALWWHLKFQSKRSCASELVPHIEAQLKVRLEEISSPILFVNAIDCVQRAQKIDCIWYAVHELAYLKQEDQAHSCTRQFLPYIYIFWVLLEQLYGFHIPVELKEYLRHYCELSALSHFYHKTDREEFWRRVLALNYDSICVDVPESSRVVWVMRTPKKMTIPLDAPAQHPQDLSYFPLTTRKKYFEAENDFEKYIPQIESAEQACWLASLIPEQGSVKLYFDAARQETHGKNLKIGKEKLGIRFKYEPQWQAPTSTTRPVVALDPETLRPYKQVNGVPWQQLARQILGENRRVVCANKYICDYTIKNKQPPESFEEFLIYVYKRETGRGVYITFHGDKYDTMVATQAIRTIPAHVLPILEQIYLDFKFLSRRFSKEELVKRLKKGSAGSA